MRCNTQQGREAKPAYLCGICKPVQLISSSLSFRLALSLELLRFFAQDLDGLLDRVQVGAQAQDGYA